MIFYQVYGTVKVHNTAESREILDDIENWDSELEVDVGVEEGAILELEVSGGTFCTYTAATEFDELLQSLNPYVVAPAVFHIDADGSKDDIYLGDKDGKIQSENMISEARNVLNALTPEDRQKVLDEFNVTKP